MGTVTVRVSPPLPLVHRKRTQIHDDFWATTLRAITFPFSYLFFHKRVLWNGKVSLWSSWR